MGFMPMPSRANCSTEGALGFFTISILSFGPKNFSFFDSMAACLSIFSIEAT